jgi:translation initiation factor 2 subunit 1
MVITKNPFPELGELVIARVVNVQSGYVEVELEDYRGLEEHKNARGMIHISELSNRWVRNINSIIAVGQRTVLLVLRIDKDKGYVDLSLRRVTKEQKSSKMNSWRYSTKAENLLKFFAENHGTTLEEFYKNLLFPLIEKYGDLRSALEVVKEDGLKALESAKDINLPDTIKTEFVNYINSNVTIHKVEVSAEFRIRSLLGNGIRIIRDALIDAKNLKKPKGVEVKVFYVGSPNYRVEIEANDYADAEKHLEKMQKKVEKAIGKMGSVELVRENLSNEQKSSAPA